jgi:excisionase family DNA binding protein
VATPSPEHEAFLTTEEVLAYLQVNLRTVYRLIDAGKLPAVRVGRQWRFRRRDIDAWLDEQQQAAPAVPAAAAVARPSATRRVLVVDPDGAAREVIATALRAAGHTVDTAPDGVVAVDRLGQQHYDLLVTELRVPALDAFGVLREGRRRVAGYLVKPVRASEVVAAAARVLA